MELAETCKKEYSSGLPTGQTLSPSSLSKLHSLATSAIFMKRSVRSHRYILANVYENDMKFNKLVNQYSLNVGTGDFMHESRLQPGVPGRLYPSNRL